MKQQTAMQELIEWVNRMCHEDGSVTPSETLSKATELLEKEKNIIVDAYDNGYTEGANEAAVFGENYYQQTYIK